MDVPSSPADAGVGPVAGSARPELMAPAGGLEAGYAAFRYGADAVYTGLKRFSARADAENLTLEELGELAAFAHAQTPRRRVFVTLNTLVCNDELADVVDLVGAVAEAGADALIVQDLGVFRIAHRHFPELRLHASTQLAVHDRAGVAALGRLGFDRVTLARELTLDEIRQAAGVPGVEVEVFVHGALCYSYSGLCLASSQLLGRSGNRGRCAYLCRDAFTAVADGAPPGDARYCLSMKDLALPDELGDLCRAGVHSLKIEGRKKSPLYVAAVTDFYRRLLDGTLAPGERAAREADLQSIFSRAWTRLYLREPRARASVVDPEFVGHRGTLIGEVDRVLRRGRDAEALRFRTRRDLERHDGLQIDVPGSGRPFGFAVDDLRLVAAGGERPGRAVFEAPAGAWVEVALPPERPAIPVGAAVYCSSSQAVKRRFPVERPKPGAYRRRHGLDVVVDLRPDGLRAVARVDTGVPGDEPVQLERAWPGPFSAARDPARTAEAVRETFASLGNTRFALEGLSVDNPDGLFVPLSRLNACRRELVAAAESVCRDRWGARCAAARSATLGGVPGMGVPAVPTAPVVAASFAWALKVDRVACALGLGAADWEGVAELVVDISCDPLDELRSGLDSLATRLGRERLRLALPMVSRSWEAEELSARLSGLAAAGWYRWEIANVSGWEWLRAAGLGRDRLDLACDWSVYVLNRAAARQLGDLGASRFVCSPEDGLANLRSLLSELADRLWVVVYQDTPLLISESCPQAGRPGCTGLGATCGGAETGLRSSKGDEYVAVHIGCRTVLVHRQPYCLAERLEVLRAAGVRTVRVDFVHRAYAPARAAELWRDLRAGRPVAGRLANADGRLA